MNAPVPCYEFKGTAQQRANLETLALHLDLEVTMMEFNMAVYFSDGLQCNAVAPPDFNVCGTVGCALGHGYALGIGERKRYHSWMSYAEQTFGVGSTTPSYYIQGYGNPSPEFVKQKAFAWLFNGGWAVHYPTSRDAAARIRFLLKYGVPVHTDAMRRRELALPAEARAQPRVEAPAINVNRHGFVPTE